MPGIITCRIAPVETRLGGRLEHLLDLVECMLAATFGIRWYEFERDGVQGHVTAPHQMAMPHRAVRSDH